MGDAFRLGATDILMQNSNETIEQQIMEYLSHNPNAQDTLEGIAEWWLLTQRAVAAVRMVKAALNNLVLQGRINAQTGADGRVHYGISRPRNGAEPQRR